jgi:hypothetical protein
MTGVAIAATAIALTLALIVLGVPPLLAVGAVAVLSVMPLRPTTVLVALTIALAVGYLATTNWLNHHPQHTHQSEATP